MKIQTRYRGSDQPFEGDRILLLQELPVGAQVTSAQITLTPVAGLNGQLGVEAIDLAGTNGNWGTTKTLGSAGTASWLEIDFHARRTLHRMQGSAVVSQVQLQVDMGGAFVRVANDGSLWVPGDDLLMLDLSPNQATLLPGLVAIRIRLFHNLPNLNRPDLNRIDIRSNATNVQLGLDQMAPFWTKTGELTQAQTTPNFAEILQAYLAEAASENGIYRVPIRLHSDLITRLDVEVNIEYSHQVASFPNGLEEVKLPFNYASLPNAEASLLNVTLPEGARVIAGSTTTRISGAFADTRVALGQTGMVEAKVAVPVTATRSQAQPVLIPAGKELSIQSIDLLLAAVTRTAEVNINFMPDSDGKPFGDALLDQPASISLTRDNQGSLTWVNAKLARKLLFKPDKLERLWLVVQVAEGEVTWGADTTMGMPGPTLQFSDSGGLAWRATTQGDSTDLAAYFRLRYKPPRFQVPIELQIGIGDEAKRVALDRFQPLNRVDFRLDFDEVAGAINQFLANRSQANPKEVELIVNGDFSRWPPSGFEPASSFSLPLANDPIAMASAPFGAMVYLLSRDMNVSPGGMFQISDLACARQNQLAIANPPIDFTLNPSGTRAYILASDLRQTYIHVIDTSLFGEIGALHLFSREMAIAGAAALPTMVGIICHPNGRHLYLAGVPPVGGGSQIWVVDVNELEQRVLTGNTRAPVVAQISLNDGARVQAMAISRAGQSLFLATSESPSLHIMDTATNQLAAPVPLEINPRSFALAPDGGQALIANENNIRLIDVMTGESILDLGPISEEFSPDLAFASDGKLAIATLSSERLVRIFDLQTDQIIDIELENTPRRLTMAPGDQTVYAAISQNESLTLLETRNPGPSQWTLTAGRVNPIPLPGPARTGIRLGHTHAEATTGFSQVVALVGGQTYRLQFYAYACDTGGLGEIHLIDAACNRLLSAAIPITLFEPELVSATWNGLAYHELRVDAPAEAVQAEVRFIVPAGNTAVIDRVSLMLTSQAVKDRSLTEIVAGKPAHWQLTPENATGIRFMPGNRGTLIENFGEETVTLSQTLAIQAEKPFVTELHADATHLAMEPKLELQWIAEADGTPAPAVLMVSATAANRRIIQGTVPRGTSQVVLALQIPPQSTLDINQLSLTQPQNNLVPITIVAQAPGEVTVTDARVNFELDPFPRPIPPPQGLCQATPPADNSGADNCCCCPACGYQIPMAGTPIPLSTDDSQNPLGTCPDCGEPLVSSDGTVTTNTGPLSLNSLPFNHPIRMDENQATSAQLKSEKVPVMAVKAKKSTTKPALTAPINQVAQEEPPPGRVVPTGSKPEEPVAITAATERADLTKTIATLLEDPQLKPLVEKAFKLTTIHDWSVARLVKHLARG